MIGRLTWRGAAAASLLALIPAAAWAQDAAAGAAPAAPKIDTGDTAWMLISAALVLLMTPGLALFYGGMVRRKNILGTIMQSFIAMGAITILWVVIGYTIAFGGGGNGFLGN